jgi:hypothetical protein
MHFQMFSTITAARDWVGSRRIGKMIVEPYRGDRYGEEKPLGLSILILGESSFHKHEAPGLLPADWNTGIIECVFQRQADLKVRRDWTISRAVDLFFDEPLNFPDQYCEFWRTATFANFIQNNLFTADGRKRKLDWESGKEPFQQYLIDLRPQFVLVDGCELWTHLPTKNRTDGPCVKITGEARPMPRYRPSSGQLPEGTMPSYLYPNDDGYAFVFGVQHTSRISHKVWRPWVEAAVEQAILFHEHPLNG